MNDEPGKQGKEKAKKGGLWPWLLLGGGITAYFAWKAKKKADVEKAERQRKEELLRREQELTQESPRSESPGRTLTLPKETGFSASQRFKAMGIDPSKPAHYQEKGDPYAG